MVLKVVLALKVVPGVLSVPMVLEKGYKGPCTLSGSSGTSRSPSYA